ncbi:MAG: MATE family efflux transporter [Candidatus Hydrogenedens sp.]|nr:MATE family efflux transporter [Candidatus Hydrogenedens sp.]
MKKFDDQIVSGSILRSVWKLAWPVTLLNLVNGLHGLVDHILIGQYHGSENNAANAAIGVSWQVFLVIVVFISSLFHGMNVLIARYAGKQDRHNMSHAAYHAFLSSVYILVFILAPCGYFLAPHLIDLVGATPEVKLHALPYLRIMFTCGAPLFLMFMMVGAFQASGDPKTPLVLGVLATILNIAISATLIVGIGPIPPMGTVGAALGTVLAPLVSVSIGLILIARRRMILQPPEKFTLIPDLAVMRVIARIGLPTGVQGVLLNIGGVMLLWFIGRLEYSASAMAAYTICYSQLFSLVTWTSFGLRSASATVMGQNIGAEKPERGKKGVAIAAGLGFAWASVIGIMFWTIPGPLLGLFDATSEPVFSYGVSLLHILAFSGIVLAPTLAFTGGLQGAGETKIPMYIAFATQILLLLAMCGGFYWAGTLTTEKIWFSILSAHSTRLVLTYAIFRTEAWTRTQVELASDAA